MLKYALLGFLKYESKTGYDLKQTMDKSTGHFWHAKQSQIYTTLKKLEENGLLISHPEPQERRPDRRVTRRDPYLDPLAYLQIDLLRKYRDEGQSEADRMQWQAALLSSINGIAAGLRNTG